MVERMNDMDDFFITLFLIGLFFFSVALLIILDMYFREEIVMLIAGFLTMIVGAIGWYFTK